MKNRFLQSISITILSALAACGGGSGGGSDTVTISGTISYDRVPQVSATSAALDYNRISQEVAKGIVVEALSNNNTVLDSTVSDDSGNYSVTVSANAMVRIRAKAQLKQNTQWDFQVTDNTNGNALYALDGSLASSGTGNSTRNLNASSGWTGSAYTQTRAAAPFAMLDVIYNGIQKITANTPNTVFPAAEIRWSVNNRPNSGDLSSGDIRTSFFTVTGNLPTLYILGAANIDTDEYDIGVIAHEWTHYLENALSRSDSIGGQHGLSDSLDMRVSFGEGLGNAMAGIINDNGQYADSFGNNQGSTGVFINLETAVNSGATGWFSEDTIQTVLFDIADSNADGQDTLSLGIDGIMSVLTNDLYKNNTAMTSIFTFADVFTQIHSNSTQGLNNLLSSFKINSTNAFATGETNNAFTNNVLPVYNTLAANGSASNVCSISAFGGPNKLSNFRFLTLNITTPRSYTIRAVKTSGPVNTDPDIQVFLQGARVGVGQTSVNNSESINLSLNAGTYIVSVDDFFNRNGTHSNGAISCFDITAL